MSAAAGLLLCLLTSSAVAPPMKSAPIEKQKTAATLHGTFTATVGRSAGFRGRWSGQMDARNSGSGSWILLNDANRMVAEGTWAAQKSAAGWRGNWTAWAKNGRSYSGSWQADLEEFSGKTFEDMLKSTLEKQVSGSWRSGKLAGNWWLQGARW